ncbi:MAG: hypothetical protein ACJAZ3_000628 [Sphingobacteriales bacterium]|jgi:hypothetical protein
MNKRKSILLKVLFITVVSFFFVAIFSVFSPVPIVPEEKAIVETAVVTNIYEGGIKDVVFICENHPRKFYINRGLENGLNLTTLKEQLIGQEVTFKYPKYWTPLDWNDEFKHVSKVELDGVIVFNELK